jgi:iron(III) transport system substrate-binding protein
MSNQARKILAALSAMGVVASALSACSSSGGPSGGVVTNAKATATVSAGPANSALDAVCQKGGQEGEVDYWTEQDPSVFGKEASLFEKAYPKIKVKVTQLQPQDQVTRALTEIQAHHKLTADVLAPDPVVGLPLFQGKHVQSIDLSQYGVSKDLATDVAGTTVYTTQRVYQGIAFNTQQYKAADLPDTWKGLVDSKFAGKISVDPRAKWLAPIVTAPGWGMDATVSWYKDLLKVDKPQIVNGATNSLTKVSSGEVPLTTSARNAEVNEQRTKGAPLDIKYLDIVPVHSVVASQLVADPHPNAATCFLAWLAGPVGQAQQFKYEFKSSAKPDGIPANSVIADDTSATGVKLISEAQDKMAALTK